MRTEHIGDFDLDGVAAQAAMGLDLSMQHFQFAPECDAFAGAGEVVQFVGQARLVEEAGHGEQGRDADAAGDQDGAGGVAAQREVVAGFGNGQHVALAHAVHQHFRAAL
ncbi:hypothetical protein D3C87_1935930 [compost metagenome]